MRSISIIVIVCLLIMFGIAVYLAVQNRNSAAMWSKLIPALAIGVIGTLFTIWFSLKSENVDRQFVSTILFHRSDKKPLDNHDKRRHLYGGDQFDGELQDFIGAFIENNENLSNSDRNSIGNEVMDFYLDVVVLKLLARFFWMYADWWDIHIDSVRRGDSTLSTVTAIKPVPPSHSLTWAHYLRGLERKEHFATVLSSFSDDFWIKKMTVPPRTQVDVIASDHSRTLRFTNPFVRISIAVSKRGGSVGLGDYRWLLGYDNKRSDDFWSIHFDVNCTAEFQRARSGHPDMSRHRQWVETMFSEIRYQLDDQERLTRARDYRDLISR